ncbi:MAG: PadR family transcriptional regulator [Chloroflexota bacterium]
MSPEGVISRELKRGTLEMLLLHLLARGETYGYQLAAAVERRLGAEWQLKEGTLYPVLYRLEDAGLVATRWETQEQRGVPRKYYRLTAAGVERLEQLVAEWRAFTAAVERVLSGGDEQ